MNIKKTAQEVPAAGPDGQNQIDVMMAWDKTGWFKGIYNTQGGLMSDDSPWAIYDPKNDRYGVILAGREPEYWFALPPVPTAIMKVKLAACGNPDHGQSPDPLPGVPSEVKEVGSFAEASAACRAYIEKYNLGGGNWAGGMVTEDDGGPIAKVSYNGRVWRLPFQNDLLFDPTRPNTYAVAWRIDIEADSPEEAVKKARQFQLAPDTTATVFEVTSPDGTTETIDIAANVE